jgi:hypothetical protein
MKLSLAAMLVLLAGCTTQRAAPTATQQPTADAAFNAVWDASMDVLWDYRFAVDKAVPREGLIRTYPLLAPHGLELWRKDAVAPHARQEGTLQSIYRVATVNVQPAEQTTGRAYYVTVAVEVYRSDRDRPEITSTGQAYDMVIHYSSLRSTGTGLGRGGDVNETPLSSGAEDAWMHLGQDKELAALLQQKITNLAQSRVGSYPQPLSTPNP